MLTDKLVSKCMCLSCKFHTILMYLLSYYLDSVAIYDLKLATYVSCAVVPMSILYSDDLKEADCLWKPGPESRSKCKGRRAILMVFIVTKYFKFNFRILIQTNLNRDAKLNVLTKCFP